MADIDEGVGKNLDEPAALKLADDYCRKFSPELTPHVVLSKSKIDRVHRTDYKFDMAIPKFNAGSTVAKLNVEVKGNEFSYFRVAWDVPDTWSCTRSKMRWYQQLDLVVSAVVGVLLLVIAVLWSVHVLKSAALEWKSSLFFTGLAVIVSIVAINQASLCLASYNTAETFTSFVARSVAWSSIGLLLCFMRFLLLSIVGFNCLKVSFPMIAGQVFHGILLAPQNQSERKLRLNLCLDAVIGSYTLSAVLLAINVLAMWASHTFSPSLSLEIPGTLTSLFSSFSPAIQLFTAITYWVVFGLMLFALLGSLWQKYLNSTRRSVSFIVAAALLMGMSVWHWQDCLIKTGIGVVLGITIWWFVTRVFRMNALCYAFALLQIVTGLYLMELIAHVSKIAPAEIGLAVLFLCAPLALAAIVWMQDRHLESQSE